MSTFDIELLIVYVCLYGLAEVMNSKLVNFFVGILYFFSGVVIFWFFNVSLTISEIAATLIMIIMGCYLIYRIIFE